MVTRTSKHIVLIAALLLMGCYAQAQNEVSTHASWLSGQQKKLLIELKAGRGFLSNKVDEGSEYSKVFYGGGNLSYGLMLNKTFVGLGAGAEYVDMKEGSYDFPVFLNVQHTFSKEADRGFFIGAKLGYIFGGKKSVPVVFYVSGEEVNGAIDRSMQGFYGEAMVGYRIPGVSFFLSYNYRRIGYESTLHPDMYTTIPYQTYSRDLYMVMAGVAFKLF